MKEKDERSMKQEKLSVVIPCYKSEKTIGKIVCDVIAVLSRDGRYAYEVILVNDGSPDGTWPVLKELAEKFDMVRSINLSRNFGQHSALMAGYRDVTGDIIVGLDDDGEHDPADLFKLVDKLQEGYDYVCASYSHGTKKSSLFRNFGSRINSWMAAILINKPSDINLSSYYVERRFVTDQIASCTNPFPYIAGLLVQATHNMAMVELPKHERMYGSSGYTLKKLLSLWINGFTAFSVKPLRVATMIGSVISCGGFLYGMVIVIQKLLDPALLIGYASTMAVLLLIGGMLMLMLGLVGEYIGRIYISLNGVPQYVIREVCGGDKKDS